MLFYGNELCQQIDSYDHLYCLPIPIGFDS